MAENKESAKCICQASTLFDDVPKSLMQDALLRGAIAAALINKRIELCLTKRGFARFLGVRFGRYKKMEAADYDFRASELFGIADRLMIELKLEVNEEEYAS